MAALDDAAIAARASAALRQAPVLGAVGMDVDTVNGTVGHWTDLRHRPVARNRAETIAKTVSGVMSVSNPLVVMVHQRGVVQGFTGLFNPGKAIYTGPRRIRNKDREREGGNWCTAGRFLKEREPGERKSPETHRHQNFGRHPSKSGWNR